MRDTISARRRNEEILSHRFRRILVSFLGVACIAIVVLLFSQSVVRSRAREKEEALVYYATLELWKSCARQLFDLRTDLATVSLYELVDENVLRQTERRVSARLGFVLIDDSDQWKASGDSDVLVVAAAWDDGTTSFLSVSASGHVKTITATEALDWIFSEVRK